LFDTRSVENANTRLSLPNPATGANLRLAAQSLKSLVCRRCLDSHAVALQLTSSWSGAGNHSSFPYINNTVQRRGNALRVRKPGKRPSVWITDLP